MTEIRFYLPIEVPYGALSNYYPRPLLFDGSTYPSSEHAYQAAKARRPVVREWIAEAPTPMLAAAAGDRLPDEEVASGWTSRQVPLMQAILLAKFTQHADLRTLLVSTGDALLIESALEDNATNRFWSKVGGEGMNMLGRLLMELRSALRAPP
jgi:ribA/ribD-fused uncharacterized protein